MVTNVNCGQIVDESVHISNILHIVLIHIAPFNLLSNQYILYQLHLLIELFQPKTACLHEMNMVVNFNL